MLTILGGNKKAPYKYTIFAGFVKKNTPDKQ